MRLLLFSVLLLLSGCVSQFEQNLMNNQLAKYSAQHEQLQKQDYIAWLQQHQGEPVKAGYLRFQNFTQQRFTVSLVHPDTQQVYHTIMLPPLSEGWFPAADNDKKVLIGSDWALKTTNYLGSSHLLVMAKQQYCARAEGKAFQNHYGVDQNFWSCQFGVQSTPGPLTKFELFPAAQTQAITAATDKPVVDVLSVLGGKQQTTTAKAVVTAPVNAPVKPLPPSDKERVIFEDFSSDSGLAKELLLKNKRVKSSNKKGFHVVKARTHSGLSYMLTHKDYIDWEKYQLPLDMTRDIEYEVVVDISKRKNSEEVFTCLFFNASNDLKSSYRWCISKTGKIKVGKKFRNRSKVWFLGAQQIDALNNDNIYKLTVKKIDGQIYYYVDDKLYYTEENPSADIIKGGSHIGVVVYDKTTFLIDSFSVSYLKDQKARYPDWKIKTDFGDRFGDTLIVYNYQPKKYRLNLWDPITRTKYSDYYVNPEGVYKVKIKNSQTNALKVNGNWGVEFPDQPWLGIKALHQVAKRTGSNNATWEIRQGDYAASKKRREEKIAAQKRLEATPEYQAKMAKKRIADCRSSLQWQNENLNDAITTSAKPICESDYEIAMTSYNNGNSLSWLRESCLNSKVGSMRRDFETIRSQVSRNIGQCRQAGIDISDIAANTRQTVALLESQYNARVSAIESSVRARDEAGRNRIAAEKRAHEAQMEANFQEWAGRMRGQDYNSFLDSIGHDSSSSGVTAQSRKIVRDYAQAQQARQQVQQDYTRLLAEIEQKTNAIKVPEPKPRQLTPQEKCARDKQKDKRLYWDARSNRCMIKMYENNVANIKDIGVATTDSGSRESSNNRVNLTGSAGVEEGVISNKQVTETLYFIEPGNSFKNKTRFPVGSLIHGDKIVAYRTSYLPRACPAQLSGVATWYTVITERKVTTFSHEIEKMKKNPHTFSSLTDALSKPAPNVGLRYFNKAEAEAWITTQNCGSGGASQQ